MSSLTSKQKEIFNYVVDTIGSDNALSVCILGAPGTGKTVLLRHIISHFRNTDIQVNALSHTGIAAANICGSTIHSLFKFNFHTDEYETASVIVGPDRVYISELHKNPEKKIEVTNKKKEFNVVNRKNLIVIDEISSCGMRLLTSIDKTLRIVFDCSEPFGGVHMIFTGDFLQLDPVSDMPLWRVTHFPYKWTLFELTESLRNDCKLFALCNKIRSGDIMALYEILTREISDFDKETVYLFTHRKDAFEFNKQQYELIVKDRGMNEEGYIETGMRVLFLNTYNNIPNGTIGHVLSNNNDRNVLIETPFGSVTVDKCMIRVETDNDKPSIGICFGSTIHKLQGQTLKKVCVKIDHLFEYGLLNVLLSRVKNYEDLRVEDISVDGKIFSQYAITNYQLKLRYVEPFKQQLGLDKSEIVDKPPFFSLS